jgi:hypothetical protein
MSPQDRIGRAGGDSRPHDGVVSLSAGSCRRGETTVELLHFAITCNGRVKGNVVLGQEKGNAGVIRDW